MVHLITTHRSEKARYTSSVSVRTQTNMSSGGALEALGSDDKTVVDLVSDYLSNNHQDGLNNIAREIDQHISSVFTSNRFQQSVYST